MKTNIITLTIVAITLMLTGSLMAQDAQEIMKKSHMAYYYAGDDGVAEVHMTIKRSSGKERERIFTMLRKDIEDGGRQKYYTYFKTPSDVSRMTFMVWKNTEGNDDRWLYVPAVDLVKRISADDKNSSFVGSDFSYEDVSGRRWTEDTHQLISDSDTLDGRPVYVIESKPIDKGYGGYATKKSFIDKENFLPLKEEYYDDKGDLIRVFRSEKVEVIDGIPTVTTRSMENVKKDQKTTIVFENIKYNVGIDDDVFTERYLKTPPRQYIH